MAIISDLFVIDTSNLVHLFVYEKLHQMWLAKVKDQGQGRVKGQIHLIGYNFAFGCHRYFKLGPYFSLWKAAPNVTLTLTFDLENFAKGQNF